MKEMDTKITELQKTVEQSQTECRQLDTRKEHSTPTHPRPMNWKVGILSMVNES